MDAHLDTEMVDLLDHEDPRTVFASDARHWIVIYRERIALYTDLLDRAREVPSRSSTSPRAERLAGDVAILEEQMARYERRLDFWYERRWALEGLQLDRDSRTVGHRDRSVRLTGREFQLLETLAHSPGTHLPPRRLLVEAWRDARIPEETLRTYIVRLRAKLAELDAGIKIENRPRHGYALVFNGRR